MGFSSRKQITAAWPPLAASIKMFELSCGENDKNTQTLSKDKQLHEPREKLKVKELLNLPCRATTVYIGGTF